MLLFFPLRTTEPEETSWLASSSLLPIFSYPPVSYTIVLCSEWLWEVNSALCCRKVHSTRALGEDCLPLCGPSVKWEEAHISPAYIHQWIFGRTGTLSLKTLVSFTPYWGGFLLRASAVPKMGVSRSSSYLLSAPPSFLGPYRNVIFCLYWLCRG